MAVRSGEIVRTSGKTVELSPYDAKDRRVIHIALQEDPYVTSESVGWGDIRKIRIIPR